MEIAAEEREYGGAAAGSSQTAQISAKDSNKKGAEGQSQPAASNVPDLHQTIGYMQKRGDFD